jgi:hypothetical protein
VEAGAAVAAKALRAARVLPPANNRRREESHPRAQRRAETRSRIKKLVQAARSRALPLRTPRLRVREEGPLVTPQTVSPEETATNSRDSRNNRASKANRNSRARRASRRQAPARLVPVQLARKAVRAARVKEMKNSGRAPIR